MATYVGKWDCPACGTKRIPGWKNGKTVERCPACGSPSTKKWYLDDRSMVIADPEEVAKAKSKRAWTCGHCDHVNDGADTVCDSCGNPRDTESGDKQVVAREYAPGQEPKSAKEVDGTEESEWSEVVADTKYGQRILEDRKKASQNQPKKYPWRGRLIWGGIVAALMLLVMSLFITGPAEATVDGFAWERKVNIEHYGPNDYSSWDYPPSGAYNISSQEEVHHYNKIYEGTECHTESYSYVCGTVDNGNGTFSDKYCSDTREVCEDKYREEPVYATRYYYTIDEWSSHHDVKAKEENKKPFWPSDDLTSRSDYRNGAREGKYFLRLLDHRGRAQREEVSEELWNFYGKGRKLQGRRNRIYGFWMGLEEDGL